MGINPVSVQYLTHADLPFLEGGGTCHADDHSVSSEEDTE